MNWQETVCDKLASVPFLILNSLSWGPAALIHSQFCILDADFPDGTIPKQAATTSRYILALLHVAGRHLLYDRAVEV